MEEIPEQCFPHYASLSKEIPLEQYDPNIYNPASCYSPQTDIIVAENYKVQGNEYYKAKEYRTALEYYTKALTYCPYDENYNKNRSIYYSNRAAVHLELQHYETAKSDCDESLKYNEDNYKAYYRRAIAEEEIDKLDESLADYKKVLEYDQYNRDVEVKIKKIEKRIEERNEKMKDEMLGKLKDIGNTILGKFGMSLDNFKLNKDPNSGGYNISFQR